MIKIFGIKNCDTVKKALKWLEAEGLNYDYHDFKKDGLSPDLLAEFMANIDLELLVNKRGTTWRKLPDDVKEGFNTEMAKTVLLDNSSMIKRPVWNKGGDWFVGFKASEQDRLKG